MTEVDFQLDASISDNESLASNLFKENMQQHLEVAQKTMSSLEEPFAQLLHKCLESLRAGGKIIFFGNGGSAADSQHLATELTVRFSKSRAAIPALALTTDTSTLTAIANDYSFDYLFARQIEALGQRGDVAIGISTSGRSPNVLKALQTAKDKGLVTIGFTGEVGGDMHALADLLLCVPSNTTARIQEMHITLGQMLCAGIEQGLGLV